MIHEYICLGCFIINANQLLMWFLKSLSNFWRERKIIDTRAGVGTESTLLSLLKGHTNIWFYRIMLMVSGHSGVKCVTVCQAFLIVIYHFHIHSMIQPHPTPLGWTGILTESDLSASTSVIYCELTDALRQNGTLTLVHQPGSTCEHSHQKSRNSYTTTLTPVFL